MSSDPLEDFSDDDLGYAPKAGGIAARAGMAADVPYLRSLNEEQRLAVESLDGPVLVLAGAGTGKTRVLTTRLAHLLNTGKAWPGQIMAVTFTNKAAREMKDRIGQLIGGVVEGMQWLGTFHSIGVKIMRRHAELVGLKSDFSILDQDDQIRLLKQIIQAHSIDEKRWPARQLAAHIDGWKNRGLTPDKVPAGEAHAYADGKGAQFYAEYQARLKVLNAADFGDLLLECLRLFLENNDVLEIYRKKFKYMLVDEYQDTNVAQYLWLRLLAGGHKNICCVGDDDQSIYGWRGAEVDNILRFEKDFEGARVIRLERNYRSTAHILAAASGLIAHNEGRLGKTLHTDMEGGDKVLVRGHWDDDEEARAIGEDLEQAQRRGENLNDIAILVRTSAQMRVIEERFITLGLPYRVVGGLRFYERMECRDALAYLKVAAQPDNSLAFERIVNVPKRGLGDVTLRKVHAIADSNSVSLFRASQMIVETDELGPRPRASLKQLVSDFSRWRALIGGLPHTELAEMILDESGYTEMWQNDKSPKAPARLDNLKELVHAMRDFENLAGYLEHIALVMDTDTMEADEKVSLMSLHSAKGLEFDTVFLPGWEENLFPHHRAVDENGLSGLEEERRLAYVGITRAKRKAVISFAQNRRLFDRWDSQLPSRFIDELPEENVEVAEMQNSYGGGFGWGAGGTGASSGGFGESRFESFEPFNNTYSTPGWQRAKERSEQGQTLRSSPTLIEGELVATADPSTERYAEGEIIHHDKFGDGVIVQVEGNKLTIDFEDAGRKRVLDSFVTRG